MQNNNRDCRPISRVMGVGDGTCNYSSICTRGVGNGIGNNSCYTSSPITDKIDTFSSESNLVRGVNITFIVNTILIILILLILYKVYNPSISYFS